MALLIPDGFAQVTIPLKHSNVSRPAAVTFGIRNDTVGFFGPDTADAAQGAFAANIGMDSNVTIGPSVVRINNPGGGTGSFEGSVVVTGVAVGSTAPPQVAILAKKGTARLGRRGRGRMFIPWYIEEVSIDEAGALSAATLTAVNAELAGFLADLDVANLPMVLLHDSVGVTPASTPDEVTSLLADTRVGTQRRRLRG